MLAEFIHFLEDNALVEFNIIEDTDEHFENRLKLQKYTYLAKRFGLDLPYSHSMYLHGPYSKSLTSAYYELANNRETLYDNVPTVLPVAFQQNDFLNAVTNNADWLEIATTLISRNSIINNRHELVENVGDIKNGFEPQFISDVLTNLEQHNLVRIHQ